MRQLVQKLETSKATVHHIKQVAGDPQAVQMNLPWNQCTELPAGKYKKKRPPVKPKHQTTSNRAVRIIKCKSNTRRGLIPGVHTTIRTDFQMWRYSSHRGIQVSRKKYKCKAFHKFGHFTSMCFQKKQAKFKPRRPKVHQLQVGAVYVKGSVSYDHSYEDSTSEDSFCLQVKMKCKQDKEQKVPRPTHLITNLAYRLKPDHTRNLYLRARLDTCADVNLMPN